MDNAGVIEVHNTLLEISELKRETEPNGIEDYFFGIAYCIKKMCDLEDAPLSLEELIDKLELYEPTSLTYYINDDGKTCTITGI